MEQLIGFVEVERVNNTDQTHITEWALDEIERLHTFGLITRAALEAIAEMPTKEQDNILSANMRNVAMAALACWLNDPHDRLYSVC